MTKFETEVLETIMIYQELLQKAEEENNISFQETCKKELKRLTNLFRIASKK